MNAPFCGGGAEVVEAYPINGGDTEWKRDCGVLKDLSLY